MTLIVDVVNSVRMTGNILYYKLLHQHLPGSGRCRRCKLNLRTVSPKLSKVPTSFRAGTTFTYPTCWGSRGSPGSRGTTHNLQKSNNGHSYIMFYSIQSLSE